jgi:hypothetical protein
MQQTISLAEIARRSPPPRSALDARRRPPESELGGRAARGLSSRALQSARHSQLVLGPASIYSGTIFEIFLDDLCVRWKKKFKIFSELEEAGPRTKTQDPITPHKPLSP